LHRHSQQKKPCGHKAQMHIKHTVYVYKVYKNVVKD
jgi:hypothetical protein